ncbi:MAG: hypothetical protein JJ992_01335, partial [Planctomycetes bacterium]|nr:hypothetical protein [Planctomycetota bacterium]
TRPASLAVRTFSLDILSRALASDMNRCKWRHTDSGAVPCGVTVDSDVGGLDRRQAADEVDARCRIGVVRLAADTGP